MTQKIIKNAEIEVLSINELRIGDSILWRRQKIFVTSIDYINKIVIAAHPIGELEPVYSYYRILSCIEERPNTTCPGCGTTIHSLSDFGEEFCTPRCKDKYDERIKYEYSGEL